MTIPGSNLSIMTVKKLAAEKGIALVTCIVILAVLSMLGAAAILSSQTDRNIAGNETAGIQALYAAEAGISMAIAGLNLSSWPDGQIKDTDGVSWGDDDEWSDNLTIFPVKINDKVSFDVSVTVSYKRDSDTCQDKDEIQVVFNNRDCGYSNSPFQIGGYPVYIITSKAAKGTFSSKIKMELTRRVFFVNVEGAMTANGPVELAGAITIDGRQHDENGGLGGLCNYAGLEVDETGVYSDESVTDLDGNPVLFGIPVPVQTGGVPGIPSTPWGVLGISKKEFNKHYFKTPVTNRAADGTLSGHTWIQGDFGTKGVFSGNNIGGNGILVVHNPDFEAVKWEKWINDSRYRDNNCTGVDSGDETWCNDYDADESSYEPAVLGDISDGTFKGLVIADSINSLIETAEIYGAVISLTSIEDSKVGLNPADQVKILFSCESLEKYVNGLIDHKLSWQKLY